MRSWEKAKRWSKGYFSLFSPFLCSCDINGAQVRTDLLEPLREFHFGVRIGDRRRDDRTITRAPIGWQCHAFCIACLKSVDGAEDFVKVPSNTHRVSHGQ